MKQKSPFGETNKPIIRLPVNKNTLLQKAIDSIVKSEEIRTLWYVGNINAIDRLGMSDHGSVHFQIVSNIGLKIARMLTMHGVEMSVTKNFSLSVDYAELIVVMACLLHDLGMSVHREDHEEYSLLLASHLLPHLLDFLPFRERIIIQSEILHAIISHRRSGNPYTIEASIVRIADALDMSQGRSRIPYEAGQVNIHSLSAYAIDSIEIRKGNKIPIQIDIKMTNSAGIFQIDELLKEKLHKSPIRQYLAIRAVIKGTTEKKLLNEFVLQ